MPRLRTMTILSVLALLVGVAGTDWLSARTNIWPEASPTALASRASVQAARAAQSAPRRRVRAAWHASPTAVRQVMRAETSAVGDTLAATTPASVSASMQAVVPIIAPVVARMLIPISTPAATTPYEQLSGHLDGSVLLQLTVDGGGHVQGAMVARSSGDPVLDGHALTVVAGWRFAVPVDHPDGESGELSMRFDTSARLARVR